MTIEQANQYFAALPEGFAPAEELRAALPAAAQQVAYVGVAGTAGKTAAAALTAAVLQAAGFVTGLYRAGCEPLEQRVRINGEPVADALLCAAAETLSRAKPLPRAAAELAAAAACFGAAGCRLAVVELPDAGLAEALLPHAGLRGDLHRPGRREPLGGALGGSGCGRHAGRCHLRHRTGAAQGRVE